MIHTTNTPETLFRQAVEAPLTPAGEGAARRDPRHDPRLRNMLLACEGPLDLTAPHAAGLREGAGVAAMRRVAWLHRGALLWLEQDGKSVAALRTSSRTGSGFANRHEAPDYVDLLSDPCSIVYTALGPAVGL